MISNSNFKNPTFYTGEIFSKPARDIREHRRMFKTFLQEKNNRETSPVTESSAVQRFRNFGEEILYISTTYRPIFVITVL